MFNTTSPSDSVSFAQPLLDCLRVDEGGPTQADLAVLGSSQPGFDDLIDRQRVGPLLLHRLRACGLDRAFHPDCLTRLELARTDCLHRNLRIYSEARRILRALDAGQVANIVLKGLYLAEHVYCDVSARPMLDIDMLVHKQELDRASTLLRDLGYVTAAPQSVMGHRLASRHLPKFVREGAAAAIEVHWSIHDPGQRYAVDTAQIFRRAVPAVAAGVRTLTMCPEDFLLHQCIHAAYQDEFKLGIRPICDIAAIACRYARELDWPALVEHAANWRITGGAYLCLRLARDLLGAPVPPGPLDH